MNAENIIPNTGNRQTVSVIMPIRNEGAFIREAMDAVVTQDYPHHLMEVLVVDGMSTDDTREIIREYQAHYPFVRLVDNPDEIVPTGLNIAHQEARGEIIVRVDGHCVIQPDYVRRCVEYLGNDAVDGVGGPMETLTIGKTTAAKAIAQAMSSRFGVGGSAFRTVKDRKMFVDTVAFPAYRQETIRKAGEYDVELIRNQDEEYNFRLRKMGGRILMTPDIRSRYYSRSSFKSLWNQYFQYGYWKVPVMQRHPRQMSLRQFVPPAFVSALLGLSVFSFFSSFARSLLLLTTGAYLVANLVASVTTAMRSGWRYLAYLPLAFATLHISYGSGFLAGLIKFARRWRGSEVKNA